MAYAVSALRIAGTEFIDCFLQQHVLPYDCRTPHAGLLGNQEEAELAAATALGAPSPQPR